MDTNQEPVVSVNTNGSPPGPNGIPDRAQIQKALRESVQHAVRMHKLLGLDYFAIDCAECPNGSLLLFEADVAMIVHDMDPVDMFPYKKPAMKRLLGAFWQALEKRKA